MFLSEEIKKMCKREINVKKILHWMFLFKVLLKGTAVTVGLKSVCAFYHHFIIISHYLTPALFQMFLILVKHHRSKAYHLCSSKILTFPNLRINDFLICRAANYDWMTPAKCCLCFRQKICPTDFYCLLTLIDNKCTLHTCAPKRNLKNGRGKSMNT